MVFQLLHTNMWKEIKHLELKKKKKRKSEQIVN